MSECSLIERSYAFLINWMIIDWKTHSLSFFQSTSFSTLQLFRLISWQVLLFCSMTVQISIHCWFVRFSVIIWFWIETISSIEFWLAFDSSFESESDSESDLDQLSDHLLDQLLLTAVQICLLTIVSDADIAFNHHLLQSTWRLSFWSARQLSDSVFLTDIWSWSYIRITSQLI